MHDLVVLMVVLGEEISTRLREAAVAHGHTENTPWPGARRQDAAAMCAVCRTGSITGAAPSVLEPSQVANAANAASCRIAQLELHLVRTRRHERSATYCLKCHACAAAWHAMGARLQLQHAQSLARLGWPCLSKVRRGDRAHGCLPHCTAHCAQSALALAQRKEAGHPGVQPIGVEGTHVSRMDPCKWHASLEAGRRTACQLARELCCSVLESWLDAAWCSCCRRIA